MAFFSFRKMMTTTNSWVVTEHSHKVMVSLEERPLVPALHSHEESTWNRVLEELLPSSSPAHRRGCGCSSQGRSKQPQAWG